ncbi:MAG: hypothetical protein KGY76_04925 [Candidatus Thermoplasmatota archaeon]|nr:hypothetical protein [Candidatus Thermoplasmatota archaeon]
MKYVYKKMIVFSVVLFLMTPAFFGILSVKGRENGTKDSDKINASDETTVVDIMVVYTPSADSWASNNEETIQNIIDESVDDFNTAMNNSQINLDLNLVHTTEVDYFETGDDLKTDLNRLKNDDDGYIDYIHDKRTSEEADLVSLFVKKDENYTVGGISVGPTSEDQLNPSNAFSVVSVQSASSRSTFTHEIGHNFGAGHSRDHFNTPGPQLYNYSAGWRWSIEESSQEYISVMACQSVFGNEKKVLHFSNPDVYYDGNTTGRSGSANNARTISKTKETISNYDEELESNDESILSFIYDFYFLIILIFIIVFSLAITIHRKRKRSEETPYYNQTQKRNDKYCPECGQKTEYIQEYDAFYCYNCHEYKEQNLDRQIASPQEKVEKVKKTRQKATDIARCSKCDEQLRYIKEEGRWYCQNCNEYKTKN